MAGCTSEQQAGRGRVRNTLHTVLTGSKVAVRCAARFNETPSGRTRKPLQSHPRRGVDGSKNRAIMGGSLRRKRRSIGKQALRPLPQIFDSVRRILMRTSGWWRESISRRSRKSKKDSKACKCKRVLVPGRALHFKALADPSGLVAKLK